MLVHNTCAVTKKKFETKKLKNNPSTSRKSSSSKTPVNGDDWHRYYNDKYGKSNVKRESATIENIIDMPSSIINYSPENVAQIAKKNGWSVKPLKKGHLKGVPLERGGGIMVKERIIKYLRLKMERGDFIFRDVEVGV